MSFERTLRLTSVALAAAALFAAGCGNKRPPMPPPQIIPAATLDLRIQQRGDELLLSFTYPTTTLGGQPLGDLAGVEFWEVVRAVPLTIPAPILPAEAESEREAEEAEEAEPAVEAVEAVEASAADEEDVDSEETAESGEPEGAEPPELPERLEELAPIDRLEFTAAATVRATLTAAELESAIQGEKVTARFPLGPVPPGDELEAHHFAVKTLSSTGLGSPFSNVASLIRRATPEPPAEFEVEPGGVGVELSWFFAGEGPPAEEEEEEAEEDGDERQPRVEVEEISEPEVEYEAFHVYRRGAQERIYGPPLARVDRSRRVFTDRTARFGEAYIYAVAALVETEPRVETALSAEREVDYADRFAPPPPRNLVTLAERDSVRILWDASSASDVDGYLLFRAAPGEQFTAVNEEPIQELEYTDRAVVSGAVYRYRLIAVDQSGNRSVESRIAEARVP